MPDESVALVRLIAAAERYDDRKVTTVGVLGFEDFILYLSREDAMVGARMNGVELIFSGPVTEESAGTMHGKYVVVEGRFRLYPNRSSSDTHLGAIADITDLGSEDYWGRRQE